MCRVTLYYIDFIQYFIQYFTTDNDDKYIIFNVL